MIFSNKTRTTKAILFSLLNMIILNFSGGACNSTDFSIGEKGILEYNVIGEYNEVYDLKNSNFMVGRPVFMELSIPDTDHRSIAPNIVVKPYPEDVVDIFAFSASRYLLTPKKAGAIELAAFEKGKEESEALDYLTIHSKPLVSLDVEYVIFTTYDDCISIDYGKVESGKSIGLKSNQEICFDVIPRDEEGEAMLGMLDLDIEVDNYNYSDPGIIYDLTFPSHGGIVANRICVDFKIFADHSFRIVESGLSEKIGINIQRIGEIKKLKC